MALPRRFFLYGAAGVFAAIWAGKSIESVRPRSAQTVPPPRPAVIDDDVQTLLRQVEAQLMRSDFDALEADAVRYRDIEERLSGGYSKLHFYYRALGMYRNGQCDCGRFDSAIPFPEKERALHLWKMAKPNSLAAQIAMAQLWSAHAWATRGDAFADKVPPEDMAQYQREGLQALAFVKDADPKQDPEIFELMFSAFDASGGNAHDLYGLYDAATGLFPDYPVYYGRMASFLQPKWYGKPGALAEFLRKLASGGTDRDLIAFSFAVESIDGENDSGVIFQVYHVDWPTLANAFARRERYYGQSVRLRNVELRMAVGAADHASAARVARGLGDKWDSFVWSGWESFVAARDWALQPD